jgi:FPC/CPF motif-containing protein YcgG
MISVALQNWTERVLDQGTLATPKDQWKFDAYAQYKARLCAPDYPCFFGQSGELRGEMLYTFITRHSLEELTPNMRQFVNLIGTLQYERASLIAFFEPDPSLRDHMSFVARFWQILQFLHDHDHSAAVDRTPADPLWEFSFGGCEMFVVGASPTYRRCRSRNLGPGIVLVFQPRSLFIDPTTSRPIAAPVRHRIHQRMLAYDGMLVHPDIGFYGEATNREWKQYALPDDNEPAGGICPFRVHANRPQ